MKMNMLKYEFANILNRVPFLSRIFRYTQRCQYIHSISDILINRVRKCNLRHIAVENICWASQTLEASKEYTSLTLILTLIDLTLLNNRLSANLVPSLHWSRRFEYPFVYYHCDVAEYTKLRILDVGAGLNPFQILLSMLGHHVVSLDSNIKYVMKLCKIVSKLRSKVYPCLADAFQIPFKENFFDRVICISVIEHILDYLNPAFDLNLSYLILKALMCELARVTKPGGKICITFDVDLSGRRHLNLSEVNILSRILRVKIPSLPKDALISDKMAFGSLFGHNKTVLAIILRKIHNNLYEG